MGKEETEASERGTVSSLGIDKSLYSALLPLHSREYIRTAFWMGPGTTTWSLLPTGCSPPLSWDMNFLSSEPPCVSSDSLFLEEQQVQNEMVLV